MNHPTAAPAVPWASFGPFCGALRDILRIYGFEGDGRGQGEAFTCIRESTFCRERGAPAASQPSERRPRDRPAGPAYPYPPSAADAPPRRATPYPPTQTSGVLPTLPGR